MWACGVGFGDEIICPSLTYWASALPAYQLGATVVFADVDPESLCIDPSDIEHRITDRTKAIIAVHYLAYPAAMDAIMEIGRRRDIKVIEDYSHAQGGHYKGVKLGCWGDAAATSLMSGKSFAIGEGGMLVTDDRLIYERAVAYGHYERYGADITDEWLSGYAGLPLGGVKHRMHQMSAAVGRVQLRVYDERIREIGAAIEYFWSRLESRKGFRAHRIDPSVGGMSGWYMPYGRYNPDDLGGLSVTAFAEALEKEGISCAAGFTRPLHRHPLFQTADVYHQGRPTRIANSARDVREGDRSLPVTEKAPATLCSIPYFKNLDKANIDKYATAYARVMDSCDELKKSDVGDGGDLGGWHSPTARQKAE
jgi:dTDP-4-amino-4,6-dideoxygalactose transaminase